MFGEEEVGWPRYLWCCTCCCCCWFVGGEMWIVTGYPRSPWPRSSTRKSRMFGGWSAKALQGRKMGRNWKAVNIFQFWNFFRLAMIWERNVLVLHQSRSILSQYYWPLWWWKNASFLRFGVLIWDSTCFFYDATSTTVVAIRAPTIVFVPSPQYIHNVVEYKKSGLLNMILDVCWFYRI